MGRWRSTSCGRSSRRSSGLGSGSTTDNRISALYETGRGALRCEHDPRGYLVSLVDGQGNAHLRIPDEVGNLYRTRDRSDRTFGPAGELTSERTPGGLITYQHDSEGNLEKRADDGTSGQRGERQHDPEELATIADGFGARYLPDETRRAPLPGFRIAVVLRAPAAKTRPVLPLSR